VIVSSGSSKGEIIIDEAKQTLENNFPDFDVNIKPAWEPAWTVE
jgi:metal-sulfur cluster biosynthetic enzyme